MNMDAAVKAAVLGTVAAAGALLIRKSNPEMALLLGIAVVACISAAALKLISAMADVLNAAMDMSGLSTALFTPVIKCVGIGITAKLCGDICRDASQSGIASAVEFAGAAAAVYAALPLIRTLMDMVGGMI